MVFTSWKGRQCCDREEVLGEASGEQQSDNRRCGAEHSRRGDSKCKDL